MVLQQNDNKQDEIFLALAPIDSTLLAIMEMSVNEPRQEGLEGRTRSKILKWFQVLRMTSIPMIRVTIAYPTVGIVMI